MENAKAYRVPEFCKRYLISRASLYREISAQRIQIIKRGRSTLIAHEEAERWFAALAERAVNSSGIGAE